MFHSFFPLSTFLSEYHTVAQSMPSITQTVCPEERSFASTVSKYFSRPHIFRQRHYGGVHMDNLTLFLKSVMCMRKTNLIIKQQFHSFARCVHRTHIYKELLTNFKQHETSILILHFYISGNKDGECSD